MLRNKSVPAHSVHTLTIKEDIIRERPSELARLLQLLPHIKTFRIMGNRESKPPLNCGRLISFNGMLYKIFSSKSHLTKLEKVEIINMSITQIIIDIIAAIPRYNRLELRWSEVAHAPDSMTTTLCCPAFVHMQGNMGTITRMYFFLRNTKIARSVRYFCVDAYAFSSSVAFMKSRNVSLTEFLPALKTLYLLPSGNGQRSVDFLENLRIPNVVLRPSSVRDIFSSHVCPPIGHLLISVELV